MNYRLLGTSLFLVASSLLMAQEEERGFTLSGSLQTDVLFGEDDAAIGATKSENVSQSNTYLDLNLLSKYVDAGGRLEYMRDPLPGFVDNFAGQGLPYFYVTGKLKNVELTAGDFYEQFGSGFVLRAYEERSLGIDNSIRGGRLRLNPYKGVNIRMLGGNQRYYWERSEGYLFGGDVELNVDQWFRRMQDNMWYLTLGGSYVGKYEKADDLILNPNDNSLKLNLPEIVNAFDVRANLQKGNYSFLAEYAQKSYDPTADNGYIYKKGTAVLLSGSYSKRGMSILLQAKRSDNMSFRSTRNVPKEDVGSTINHLPAFAYQHTYALAILHPYGTQPDGEWAYQGEFRYNFKRKTPLGGKYGTDIRLNFSHIRSIDHQLLYGGNVPIVGSDGYKSDFFKQGELYYQDLHVDISKKLSRSFKGNFMYMWQKYNMQAIEDKEGMIDSHIFVAEGKYTINKKLTLRAELQYLHTKQYEGDWAFALAELTVLPNLMFTVSDMYNVGETKEHYYLGMVTFNHKGHRLAASYGRTRAGYNCSGGVCRYVPASKGFQISYNLIF